MNYKKQGIPYVYFVGKLLDLYTIFVYKQSIHSECSTSITDLLRIICENYLIDDVIHTCMYVQKVFNQFVKSY
jgi:hypothetical protein